METTNNEMQNYLNEFRELLGDHFNEDDIKSLLGKDTEDLSSIGKSLEMFRAELESSATEEEREGRQAQWASSIRKTLEGIGQ